MGFELAGFLLALLLEDFDERERCAHASEFRRGRGVMPRRLATRVPRKRRRIGVPG
jgi:hypothetical protein